VKSENYFPVLSIPPNFADTPDFLVRKSGYFKKNIYFVDFFVRKIVSPVKSDIIYIQGGTSYGS